MEKQYFGVYLEPIKGSFVGLDVLEGIFEEEGSARNHCVECSGLPIVRPLGIDSKKEILHLEGYKLTPFRDMSKGSVWLFDFKQSARYINQQGYSMVKVSGEEIVEELGLVEKLGG